ncbi:MAG: DUF4215 domain-containing protein, partial [Alphaproteobacteria bacterium]|nr:DUF4215 domain-containing protein [Alphaproteobacteria bacterium]
MRSGAGGRGLREWRNGESRLCTFTRQVLGRRAPSWWPRRVKNVLSRSGLVTVAVLGLVDGGCGTPDLVCGDGVVTMNEACDDGNLVDDDGCDSNCTATACGNGILTMGEACDDGNLVEGDGCDSNCTATACGNGITTMGEACDDGNLVDGDGCDSNCTATACGNSIKTSGEDCDDGDGIDDNACSNACYIWQPEILYYKFGNGGDTVPNLASSPPLGTATATLQGGITQGGANGQCMSHGLIGTGGSSTTDYLDTHWATDLGAGSWTISFWFWGQNISADSLHYVFGDVSANSFRCFTNGVAGPKNWLLRGSGFTDVPVPNAADGTLKMTTFVYDQATAVVHAYVNGMLSTSVMQNANSVAITGSGSFKVAGYSSSNASPAGSVIDDVRVYR